MLRFVTQGGGEQQITEITVKLLWTAAKHSLLVAYAENGNKKYS